MLKNSLEEIGVKPEILKYFLEETLPYFRELNESVWKDMDIVTYHYNLMVIAQMEVVKAYTREL